MSAGLVKALNDPSRDKSGGGGGLTDKAGAGEG